MMRGSSAVIVVTTRPVCDGRVLQPVECCGTISGWHDGSQRDSGPIFLVVRSLTLTFFPADLTWREKLFLQPCVNVFFLWFTFIPVGYTI